MSERRLPTRLGRELLKRNLSVACAESCTGGLLCSLLTDVPGSSAYVCGAVVAYTNEIKERLLGVNKDTLQRYGAVSRETAVEMAEGIRAKTEADIGVSTTGLAGPMGDGVNPVGTVCVAVSGANGTNKAIYHFTGSRLSVKHQAAEKALLMIWDYLFGEALPSKVSAPLSL